MHQNHHWYCISISQMTHDWLKWTTQIGGPSNFRLSFIDIRFPNRFPPNSENISVNLNIFRPGEQDYDVSNEELAIKQSDEPCQSSSDKELETIGLPSVSEDDGQVKVDSSSCTDSATTTSQSTKVDSSIIKGAEFDDFVEDLQSCLEFIFIEMGRSKKDFKLLKSILLYPDGTTIHS